MATGLSGIEGAHCRRCRQDRGRVGDLQVQHEGRFRGGLRQARVRCRRACNEIRMHHTPLIRWRGGVGGREVSCPASQVLSSYVAVWGGLKQRSTDGIIHRSVARGSPQCCLRLVGRATPATQGHGCTARARPIPARAPARPRSPALSCAVVRASRICRALLAFSGAWRAFSREGERRRMLEQGAGVEPNARQLWPNAWPRAGSWLLRLSMAGGHEPLVARAAGSGGCPHRSAMAGALRHRCSEARAR